LIVFKEEKKILFCSLV